MYAFPIAMMTLCPAYFYTMRIAPTGPTTSAMEYDVYRHKNATDAAFKETNEAFMQIEIEDKFLCTNAQRNLNAGTYTTGPLNPHQEAGVIYFQKLVREALTTHRELEKAAGHDIHRAKFTTGGESAEDKLCQELEGSCGGKGKLDW